MAKVQNVKLEVEYDAEDENTITVGIEYDITFNDVDVNNQVAYREVCKLIGVDTGVGDIGNGGDDLLLVVLDRTTGATQQPIHRQLRRNVKRSKLNEDPSPFQPRDELQAEVRMNDLDGQFEPVFAESAILADRF
jgi:hypothetical protein